MSRPPTPPTAYLVQYVMPADVPVSQSVRDLLRRLLVVDSNDRLTLSQVRGP